LSSAWNPIPYHETAGFIAKLENELSEDHEFPSFKYKVQDALKVFFRFRPRQEGEQGLQEPCEILACGVCDDRLDGRIG
jgi:hypothetical protein